MPKSSHRTTRSYLWFTLLLACQPFRVINCKASLMHFHFYLFFHFTFLTGVTSSQMGPGFPVTIPSLSVAADHYNKVQVSWANTIKRWMEFSLLAMACRWQLVWQWSITDNQVENVWMVGCFVTGHDNFVERTVWASDRHYLVRSPGISQGIFSLSLVTTISWLVSFVHLYHPRFSLVVWNVISDSLLEVL